MRLYNPLGSRFGRFITFIMLYVTEGLPQGFVSTAMANELRRSGVGTAEISAFVAASYLPWTWKWVIGPIVDNVYSTRLGRRRAWIVGAQVMMILALLAASSVELTANLSVLMGLVIVISSFAATQDVAIDALACETLEEHDRGLANGLMFAGAQGGIALGGAGAIKLKALLAGHVDSPFTVTYFAVALVVAVVVITVSIPMRESRVIVEDDDDADIDEDTENPRLASQITSYVAHALKAFFGSFRAFLALAFALAPTGGFALSLTVQTILAVDLGFSDDRVAALALYSSVIWMIACVGGGWISDRIGRRTTIATFAVLTAATTAALAWIMWKEGWINPLPEGTKPGDPENPVPSDTVVSAFWWLCLVFSFFQGSIYAVRIALFMDITDPRVAATQFTAYMAMGSVVFIYTLRWQGWAMEEWGFPKTLALDAILGVASLVFLPFLRPFKRSEDDDASG